jgi:hypothetical protein
VTKEANEPVTSTLSGDEIESEVIGEVKNTSPRVNDNDQDTADDEEPVEDDATAATAAAVVLTDSKNNNDEEDIEDNDEDINVDADEFFDDEDDGVLNKKNLFDIYNEYSSDLLSSEEAQSSDGGVVAGTSGIFIESSKEKQQLKSESAETSSDTGTTQTSTSSGSSGGNRVGKVDDALSCKNNLELLTKELNKMLDDIETQKFIINDKEIYFLNRIQNFRLLEQIKEEDDEVNEGKNQTF